MENFCLRDQRHATPILFADLASRWMEDHAKVMKASWATRRPTGNSGIAGSHGPTPDHAVRSPLRR
jgi:hypothetical protein